MQKVVKILASAVTFSGIVETVDEVVTLNRGETAIEKVKEIVGEKAWISDIVVINAEIPSTSK